MAAQRLKARRANRAHEECAFAVYNAAKVLYRVRPEFGSPWSEARDRWTPRITAARRGLVVGDKHECGPVEDCCFAPFATWLARAYRFLSCGSSLQTFLYSSSVMRLVRHNTRVHAPFHFCWLDCFSSPFSVSKRREEVISAFSSRRLGGWHLITSRTEIKARDAPSLF